MSSGRGSGQRWKNSHAFFYLLNDFDHGWMVCLDSAEGKSQGQGRRSKNDILSYLGIESHGELSEST